MRLYKKRYLKQGGVRCPYCNSFNIMSRSSETSEDGEIYRVVDCLDCEGAWQETYRLVDVKKEREN